MESMWIHVDYILDEACYTLTFNFMLNVSVVPLMRN